MFVAILIPDEGPPTLSIGVVKLSLNKLLVLRTAQKRETNSKNFPYRRRRYRLKAKLFRNSNDVCNGSIMRQVEADDRFGSKAEELTASTTGLLHPWELTVQQMLRLGGSGPTDGVIGRPSLWIAEDFGCCASG